MATPAVSQAETSAMPSPYQIDVDQTLKASQALLTHVRSEAKRLREQSSKRDLLQATDSDSDSEGPTVLGDDQPIFLTLTTKQHIVDRHRLTPNKIKVPHSLNKSANLSICLITADPQRAVKNIVSDPSFPQPLYSKISKIIGYSKLKARYNVPQLRRQLLSEHDVFLADDRIVTRLPETLGKIFYKGTAKRPIPITISYREREDGKFSKPKEKKKASKDEKSASFASPAAVAKEIESALNAVPTYLKPGTSVAIRVGLASFTTEQLAENVAAVSQAVIERHVVKGWRNVKTIFIKSTKSPAVPIWMADDMWVEDNNVIEDTAEGVLDEPEDESKTLSKRKRNPTSKSGPQVGARKKAKNTEPLSEKGQDREATTARKAKLAEQKKVAFKPSVAIAAQ